jgi:hypothetical protein
MKRLQLPDLLKGFAVFLIVPVHILETFIDYPGRESLFGKVLLFLGGPFGVPVFMIVMGYFIARNKKPLKQNLLRGVKVFLLGFLLNIGLNFHLLLKIKFAGWPYNSLEYIFGVDIFYLAGLSLIILSLIKVIKIKPAYSSLILALIVFAGTGFMNNLLLSPEKNYVLPFIAGEYSWSYFPLFPWLAYPLIGFSFYFFEDKIRNNILSRKWMSASILIVLFFAVISFSKSRYAITVNLPKYYHHTFWFALWALAIVVIWAMLLRGFLNKFPSTILGNFYIWLGKNISVFYIIQWLIIGNIATAIYQTQPMKTYIFWFVGIFLVTAILTRLLEKLNVKIAR